jgi:hypothetical protein
MYNKMLTKYERGLTLLSPFLIVNDPPMALCSPSSELMSFPLKLAGGSHNIHCDGGVDKLRPRLEAKRIISEK